MDNFDNPDIDDVMDDLKENYLMDYVVLRMNKQFICNACNHYYHINSLNRHLTTEKHMMNTIEMHRTERTQE